MKKIIYLAAAAALLAACAKDELNAPKQEKLYNIALDVAVNTQSTKVSYDGDGLINFSSSDKFRALIAKTDAPTTAIKVASASLDFASQYYYDFKLVDGNVEDPHFYGYFYSIVEENFAPEYIVYGLMGNTYSATNSDLTAYSVEIDKNQNPTQSSWDGENDTMLASPFTISTEGSNITEYQEYDTPEIQASVNFAHLFGFAKLQFADVPAEYADYVVKSVSITATGENKTLAGAFTLDLTKNADEAITGVKANASDYVSINGDGVTTVKDFTAWFVLNPGLYDVTITVSTNRADLVFERSGLNIKRSEIAAPVVHFKGADTAISKNVVLEDDELWSAGLNSYNTITSYSPERVWGPEGKTMSFALSYPNSNNVNYGSSGTDPDGNRVQVLAYNNISGKEAILSSLASFSGVKMVKVALGVATKDISGTFDVALVKNGDEHSLGSVLPPAGQTGVYDGKPYLFTATDHNDGDLQIRFTVGEESNCRPYVGNIVINPEPWFEWESKSYKLTKEAVDTVLNCPVLAAFDTPVASCDAEWISTSYAEGKLTLNVQENTGAKRSAKVFVKTTGLRGEYRDSIEVTQASATAKTWKLSINPADIYPHAQALVDENTDEYTKKALTCTLNAVAQDGSEATKPVEIAFSQIYVGKCTESEIYYKADLKCTSSLGEIKSVYTKAAHKLGSSSWGLCLKLSADGSTYSVSYEPIEVISNYSPYECKITNADDALTYFNLYDGSWSEAAFYTAEIVFVAD